MCMFARARVCVCIDGEFSDDRTTCTPTVDGRFILIRRYGNDVKTRVRARRPVRNGGGGGGEMKKKRKKKKRHAKNRVQ